MTGARRTKAARWWGGGAALTTTALILSCNAIVGIETLSGEHLAENSSGTGAGGSSTGPGGSVSGNGGENGSGSAGEGSVSSAVSSGTGSSSSAGSGSGTGGAMPCTECTWSQEVSSAGNLGVLDLALDTNGDVVLVGSLDGTVDFGNMLTSNGQDIFVAKLGKDGMPLWSKSFGDAHESQRATGVAINKTDHSIIVVGDFDGAVTLNETLTSSDTFTRDILVAKLQSDGVPVWSKRFGNPSTQYAEAVALDSTGDMIVVGYFTGSIDFTGNGSNVHMSSGLTDMFVAKLNSKGEYRWSKKYGDGDAQRALGVAVDASDNIVITGDFLGTVDFGCPSPLTAPGSVEDLFVVQLASDGTCVWSKAFGSASGVQQGNDVAVDSAKDVLVAGEFQQTLDFKTGINSKLTSSGGKDAFVVKLSGGTGNALWSASVAGTGDQSGASVVSDMKDNVLVTGYMQGDASFGSRTLTSGGTTDAFVVRLDPAGNPLCGERYGDADGQAGKAIVSDAAGSAIFALDFAGSVNVCTPRTSAGQNNLLVSKITFTP